MRNACFSLLSAVALSFAGSALLSAGAVSGQWHLLDGTDVTVSAADPLRLPAGEPPATALRLLPPGSESPESLWLDVLLLPVADDSFATATRVEAAGVKLAFLSESPETGRVWVGGEPDGEWSPSDAVFPLVAWGGALDWLRITVESRPSGGGWRLWIDYTPAAAGDSGEGATDALVVHGHDAADVWVAGVNWAVSSENPFFADRDGGSEAAALEPDYSETVDETVSASDPGAGEPAWESMLVADENSGPGVAAPAIIYVNSLTGDDARCGRVPNVFGSASGPKRGIRAAVDAVADGGVIVIEEGEYASPGELGGRGKRITLRPVGSVVFR